MDTKEDLKQLVLLEKVKNCLPDFIHTYLNEQTVTTIDKPAVLSDEFMLTHKISFDKASAEPQTKAAFTRTRSSTPGGQPLGLLQRRLDSIGRILVILLQSALF